MIVGFWNKNCYSLHSTTFNLYTEISKGNLELPQWLVKTRTTLISKGGNTRDPKNYRPIACENIMLKVYTGCIGLLIEEHCIANDIIAPEQAGAKKEMWGCVDQLLINKVVLEEVKKYLRNLFTVWLDYRKAYDSIPHPWILVSQNTRKHSECSEGAYKQMVYAIKLTNGNSNIDAGEIRYNKGVLQGDFLSVVLFILSLNPGSFLINKTTGYKIGPEEDLRKSLTHLLFVDDMKTFSSSVNGAKFQLDIITTFSTDLGMKFSEDKCGYIYIERGK